MKKELIVLITVLLFLLSALPVCSQDSFGFSDDKKVELYFFYGQGCPHCNRMENFLSDIGTDYPELDIIKKETYFNAENRELFQEMASAFDTSIKGVPTVFIDDKEIVGFSTAIGHSLEMEIQRCIEEGCNSPLNKIEEINGNSEEVIIVGESSPAENPEKTEKMEKLTIGAVLVAALVDAINPCAFAVLIILLTTILIAGVKRRILFAGLAFTASIYISYFLMGIGLYSAIQASGLSHTFYTIVAVLAIVLGLFNLKDFLWYGKWFVLEVPVSWRPKLQSLIKGITSVPGAFLIGFAVSLFLLPCTSGPYIVILGLLAKTTTRNYALLLLLLYNLIFILPMLIITLAIYFGLTTTKKAEKWRKGKLEVLHLIAGIIMILLGAGMFIAMSLGMI